MSSQDQSASDSFTCGLKVRKPYTITKQREKWTDEEHIRFLEALKLHGRAWKKIEEHVGSKTAVQIRSHAQKFFSKVVRESNGSTTGPTEPIEIPPPRPKRKPMHPYPRKLSHSLTKEHQMPEVQMKSASQQLYASEHDNQSPTSVLSAVGSDTMGSADSNSPNGSLSPASSAGTLYLNKLVLFGTNSSAEGNASLSPSPEPIAAINEKKVNEEFELFAGEGLLAKEVSTEEASNRSLKLFGKTVLVADSHRWASPSKLQSGEEEAREAKPVRSAARNFSTGDYSLGNENCASNIAPFFTRKKDSLDSGSAAYAPSCWTFSGAGSSPFVPYHLLQRNADSDCKEDHEKDIHKEGSLSGSNTGPVDQGETSDKVLDAEEQSCQLSTDLELRKSDTISQFKPSEKSAFHRLKTTATKCMRGFVPYKRCLAERDTASSSRIEERAETRIRLSL